MSVSIERVSWENTSDALKEIRYAVFVVEQDVPVEEEWDGQDETAIHFLATVNGLPVGTARLLPNGQITRMAVLQDHRGQGIGAELLRHAIKAAIESGCEKPFLHAQTHALTFYEEHGFVAHGEEFLDAGIPHYAMEYRTESGTI